MQVIKGRGVNELYSMGMDFLLNTGVMEDSRNGPVIVADTPVTSVYAKPDERVIFDARRNANPFFHLFEGLWMLAGRDDVAGLDNFIGDFGSRFAEPDGKVHGAYGHRWRHALGFDQLEFIIKTLRADSTSRQCVLQMWDARAPRCPAGECDAPGTGSNDLRGSWKDRPCNTQIYFRVRGDRGMRDMGNGNVVDFDDRVLDMTVTCRSNDVIYGAYGANAVHFTMLQEYMAAMIGVQLGIFYQVSNNYHAYTELLERVGIPKWQSYLQKGVESLPMVQVPDEWDADLHAFMRWAEREWKPAVAKTYDQPTYANSWFEDVATPMVGSYIMWKRGHKVRAKLLAECVAASDWKVAAVEWYGRRA